MSEKRDVHPHKGEKDPLHETPVKNNFISIDNISIFHSATSYTAFPPSLS